MTNKEEWRAVLMSTKDVAYKGRENKIQSWDDKGHMSEIVIPIPDDDVLCNGCNDNIYPENGWMMEYKDGDKWRTYDIYCFDCRDKYFKDSRKCVVDDPNSTSSGVFGK